MRDKRKIARGLRMGPIGVGVVVVAALAAGRGVAFAQRGGPPAQVQTASAQQSAPVDLTGYWVSLVTEDWRWRMVTPAKGDYQAVPINAAGRKVADTWDQSMDGACQAYGAAGLMRMPVRLHITWEDDDTLKIETDAGEQTRLLRFKAEEPPAGERSLQGHSAAEWVRGGGRGGFFGGFGALGGGGGGSRWAPLKVVTTHLSGGWLRRNGVPYSEQTTMTESFLLLSEDPDGDAQYLGVVTTVEDPMYLLGSFITSTNFKREPDGSKWNPKPCRILN